MLTQEAEAALAEAGRRCQTMHVQDRPDSVPVVQAPEVILGDSKYDAKVRAAMQALTEQPAVPVSVCHTHKACLDAAAAACFV